jgi:hypothetical protein
MYKRTRKDIFEIKEFIVENFLILSKKEIYRILLAKGYSYPTIEKYYTQYLNENNKIKQYEEENIKLKNKLNEVLNTIDGKNDIV